MTGYDFNNVVDTGKYIPENYDVIITGKYITHAHYINEWLSKNNIQCAVYYMPYLYGENNILIMALWKVEMIQKLKVTKFYEDNATQYEIIKKCCPDCEVVKV